MSHNTRTRPKAGDYVLFVRHHNAAVRGPNENAGLVLDQQYKVVSTDAWTGEGGRGGIAVAAPRNSSISLYDDEWVLLPQVVVLRGNHEWRLGASMNTADEIGRVRESVEKMTETLAACQEGLNKARASMRDRVKDFEDAVAKIDHPRLVVTDREAALVALVAKIRALAQGGTRRDAALGCTAIVREIDDFAHAGHPDTYGDPAVRSPQSDGPAW